MLIFISCEDKEDEEKDISPYLGTWDVTFIGEYENADCTGEIDSTGWYLLQAFGFESSLTLNENGSYDMSISFFGSTETETGIWEEKDDGSVCLDVDDCETLTLAANGNSFTLTDEMDAYCEDPLTFEVTSHSDSTSCVTAGNDWYEASCSIMEYTKQ